MTKQTNLTKDILAEDVDDAVSILGLFGNDHPNSREFYTSLIPKCITNSLISVEPLHGLACGYKFFQEIGTESPKLSRLLFNQFSEWAELDTDSQPGSGYSPNSFTLIYGDKTQFYFPPLLWESGHDDLVPIKDSEDICNQISSANKNLFRVQEIHGKLGNNKLTIDLVYNMLNSISLSNDQRINNHIGVCN